MWNFELSNYLSAVICLKLSFCVSDFLGFEDYEYDLGEEEGNK
jgi:hypothetical protein